MKNKVFCLSLLLVTLLSGCAIPSIVEGIVDGVKEGKRLEKERCDIEIKLNENNKSTSC